MSTAEKGFIFVLRNPNHPNHVLVGAGVDHPERALREGLLDEAETGRRPILCYSALVDDVTEATRHIDDNLTASDIGTGYFIGTVDSAVDVIRQCGVNILYEEPIEVDAMPAHDRGAEREKPLSPDSTAPSGTVIPPTRQMVPVADNDPSLWRQDMIRINPRPRFWGPVPRGYRSGQRNAYRSNIRERQSRKQRALRKLAASVDPAGLPQTKSATEAPTVEARKITLDTASTVETGASTTSQQPRTRAKTRPRTGAPADSSSERPATEPTLTPPAAANKTNVSDDQTAGRRIPAAPKPARGVKLPPSRSIPSRDAEEEPLDPLNNISMNWLWRQENRSAANDEVDRDKSPQSDAPAPATARIPQSADAKPRSKAPDIGKQKPAPPTIPASGAAQPAAKPRAARLPTPTQTQESAESLGDAPDRAEAEQSKPLRRTDRPPFGKNEVSANAPASDTREPPKQPKRTAERNPSSQNQPDPVKIPRGGENIVPEPGKSERTPTPSAELIGRGSKKKKTRARAAADTHEDTQSATPAPSRVPPPPPPAPPRSQREAHRALRNEAWNNTDRAEVGASVKHAVEIPTTNGGQRESIATVDVKSKDAKLTATDEGGVAIETPAATVPEKAMTPSSTPAKMNAQEIASWVQSQDVTLARRTLNRRAMRWSLLGVPLGAALGVGYIMTRPEFTDLFKLSIVLGAAAVGTIVCFGIARLFVRMPKP